MSSESENEDLGPLCRKLAQDNWDLKKQNKEQKLKMDIMSAQLENMKKMAEFYKQAFENSVDKNKIQEITYEQNQFYEDIKKEVGWDERDDKSVLYEE